MISGSAGADRERLLGGGQTDYLYGMAGDDVLIGNGGNDVLDGGTGNDIMYGGRGYDTYIIGEGIDQIIEEDGQGEVRDGNGRRIAGQFVGQGGGTYTFVADRKVTATKNSPLTLYLPGGAQVIIENYDRAAGSFGIGLADVSQETRTIEGDREPTDYQATWRRESRTGRNGGTSSCLG